MISITNLDLVRLREALEASWDSKTSFEGVSESGNPALGQCYPTARVVQHFYPQTEVVVGQVWTGKSLEKHFWNLLQVNGQTYHLDYSWQQFPAESSIRSYELLDPNNRDSRSTVDRVELLKSRVKKYLGIK